jgi:hypothetical protein
MLTVGRINNKNCEWTGLCNEIGCIPFVCNLVTRTLSRYRERVYESGFGLVLNIMANIMTKPHERDSV